MTMYTQDRSGTGLRPVGTRGGWGDGWGPGACPGREADPLRLTPERRNRIRIRTSTRPPPLCSSSPCPYRTATPSMTWF